MFKRTLPILALSLITASAASAQSIPGSEGEALANGTDPIGGSGSRSGRVGGHSGPLRPLGGVKAPPSDPDKPVDDSMIVGVVKSIDPASGRVTIAYEPVEERNWPAGTMPFAAENSAILKDVKVGDKVRFRLESQQIAELRPY